MTYVSTFKLQQVTRHLRQGGLLAYPTEAIYGLGCDPLNEQAVMRVLQIKQRTVEKGLILIAAEFSQVAHFLDYDEMILNRIQMPTTETITWIIPTQHWVPNWLTGTHQTLAIRVTQHPLAKTVCEQFKSPLVSTSANPSHKTPARTAFDVRRYFSNYPHLKILNAPAGGNKNPSKIYDARTGQRLR